MPLADATQTEAPAQRGRAHPGAVRVVAPARLHLGFLDLNGGLGRMFGSIGLAVDIPRTELVLKRSRTFKGDGPDHARALAMLHRIADAYSLDGSYEVSVTSAIPPHAGLGSGTQLALAAGAALMAWFLRRGDRGGYVTAMAAASVAFVGLAFAFPPLVVDRYKAPRELVRESGAGDPSRDLRLGGYDWFQPSIVFYARREVQKLPSPEKAAAVRAELLQLRFGRRETWPEPRRVFQRARAARRALRR